jgi:DNA modification methylase
MEQNDLLSKKLTEIQMENEALKYDKKQLEEQLNSMKSLCLNFESVISNLETMKRMPDNFVDLVITSPPYNIGNSRINGGFDKKTYDKYNDNLSIDEYFMQTKLWIDELLRITKHHIL